MKRKGFERHLVSMGCHKLREGANHTVWINDKNGKQATVPRHAELSNLLCKVICRQLGIPSPG